MGCRLVSVRACRYMVNTDVSITLFLAERHDVAHPIVSWFRLHGRDACYSEILRDELHDMERRGRICPGDAQRILNTLRRYGLRQESARVGLLKRSAARLVIRGAVPVRMSSDVILALHAISIGARLVSYNERDYQELARHITRLIHIRPPGEPLAYTCNQGRQASKRI